MGIPSFYKKSIKAQTMKRTLTLLLLSLSLNITLTAQRPTYKSKIGIHTGNHITLWGEG